MPQADTNDPEVDAARRLRGQRQRFGAGRRDDGREDGGQDARAQQTTEVSEGHAAILGMPPSKKRPGMAAG
jgi:hypothetical protein